MNTCKKDISQGGMDLVVIPAQLGDDKTGEVLPANGLYNNAMVKYEANGAIYFYAKDGSWLLIREGETDG